MKSFRRSIKAVSPVIATIIIVAIAITMSIAVAYWLLGLGGSFTRFEKVEFASSYVTPTAGLYNITLNLKNTGSATATIDQAAIMLNGKPTTAYVLPANWTECSARVDFNNGYTMEPGKTLVGYIGLGTSNPAATTDDWTSGMTVEVTLHTTGGKDYPRAFILP